MQERSFVLNDAEDYIGPPPVHEAGQVSRFGSWHICTRPARTGGFISFAIQRQFTEDELSGSTIGIPDEMRFEFGDTAEESLVKLHNDLKSIGEI
jgi:hypothetical protein